MLQPTALPQFTARRKSSVTRLILLSISAMTLGFAVAMVFLLMHAWDSYAAAGRVETLTRMDRELFDAIVSIRARIPAEQTALLSNDDPHPAIVEARRKASQSYDQALAALASGGLADGPILAAAIRESWDRIAAQDGLVDAEARKTRPDRSLAGQEPWRQAVLATVNAVANASVSSSNAVRLSDPISAEMVGVRRFAWTIRDAYGDQCSLLRPSVATSQPPDSAKLAKWHGDIGAYMSSWHGLDEFLARPGVAPELLDQAKRARAATDEAQKRIDAVIGGLDGSGRAAMASADWTAMCNAPFKPILDLGYQALDDAAAHAGAIRAAALTSLVFNIAGLGFALILGGVILVVIHVRLTLPTGSIGLSVARLIRHEYSVPVPPTRYNDELGEISQALEKLRLSAAETESLREAQERNRDLAAQDKIIALQRMAENVERETLSSVDRVAMLTAKMAERAGGMAKSAAAVGGNSKSVAAAASQALTNAQSVASAAEQLSGSIGQIAGQIVTATQLTGTAVQASGRAQVTIGLLSRAVERIGEIATLINNIASQTNLLALNATIEAARAGDAGKGFAVVANEVKSLATQTARATGEISAQIAEIQATTRDAVRAVAEINGAIANVQGVAANVAAAVEQQGAATREIARNVNETTQAAQEVAERIASVSDEASTTGDSAGQVGTISTEVAAGINSLREVLVRVVRTSTAEVNRRRYPRYRIALPGSVTHAGTRYAVTIDNISEGGLRVAGLAADIAEGARVEIAISGVATPFAASVLVAGGGGLHGKFELAPDANELWRAECARLTAGLLPLEDVA